MLIVRTRLKCGGPNRFGSWPEVELSSLAEGYEEAGEIVSAQADMASAYGLPVVRTEISEILPFDNVPFQPESSEPEETDPTKF